MFGLMTVKAHRKALERRDELIDAIAGQLKAEEFSASPLLSDKVRLALKRLGEARDSQFKNRQRYLTAEYRVTMLRRQLDETKAAAARDITAEQRRNERLAAEIASLRPDAEWARARKAKAAEYEANRRVRKAKGAG